MSRCSRLILLVICTLLLAGCSALAPSSPDELLGRWEGSLLFRSALTPLELEVSREADSSLTGALHARELLLHAQPVDSLVWNAPRVRFACTLGELRLRFDGFARAGRIVGRFTSADLPTLNGTSDQPKLSLRRATPPAAPYAMQRVRIDAPGAPLEATLRLPLDSLAHPGLVFVPGDAQPHERDVAAWADTFARSGWATLSWDARSGDAASDAAAAVRWLDAQPGVRGSIGLWERSVPGTHAPQVAAHAPLTFAIAVSPRLAPGADSVIAWTRVRVPVLLAFGDRDERMPVEATIRSIMQAVGEAGVNATLRVFPGAGHTLQARPRADEPFDWPRAAPGSLDSLLAWSARVAHLPPRPVPPDTGRPTLNLRPGWR